MRSLPSVLLLLAAQLFLAAAPRAETTACTPIPSLPFPINMAGIYCLTGPLTATASGAAIAVNSDDVTIDLNGWALTGPPPPAAGIGIDSPASARIVVRNGTIRGFGQGINLGPASGVLGLGSHVVERVRVEGSQGTAISVGGAGSVIRHNLVLMGPAQGPARGIIVLGTGAHVADNMVVDTRSTTASAHGIEVVFTPGGAVIERNFVSNSSASPGNVGIYVGSSRKVTVRDNRIANMQRGIFYEAGSTGFYMRNMVSGHKVAFEGGTPAGPTATTNFALD